MLPADIDGRVHYDGGLTCNFPLHAVQEQYVELRDAIYGFTFDFSRRNEVAHAWVKDEWPGITDVMVNVVSLMYVVVCARYAPTPTQSPQVLPDCATRAKADLPL
jgi:predicted acylesterase/phospholipase RssA